MKSWLAARFEVAHGAHRTIVPMEGMRGLAVLLVFLTHYAGMVRPWLAEGTATAGLTRAVHALGHSGVDLFFVLSGYLIYGMLIQRARPLLPYLRARARRIYPAFLAVFAGYLVLSFLFPAESKLPADLGAAALLVVQNLLFLPGLFEVTAIITVAWSLSYEVFYYLVTPTLVAVLGLRRWRPRSRIAATLTASVVAFALVALYGGPVRLLLFAAGILLYDLRLVLGSRRVPALGLAATALGILAAPVLTDALGLPVWVQFAAMFGLFLYACLDAFTGEGPTARLFSITPLRWFGNMSYSYYLIHGLSLKASFLVLAEVHQPVGESGALLWFGLLLPAFLATLPASVGLFLLVERRFSLGRPKATRDVSQVEPA